MIGQKKTTGTIAPQGSDVLYKKATEQNIWKSKLSWKITLSVFLTMIVIQASVMSFTVTKYEDEKLYELRQNGLSAIGSLMAQRPANARALNPVSKERAERLFQTSSVKGIGVYGLDVSLLGTHGIPSAIYLDKNTNLQRTYRSADKSYYEVIYSPAEIGNPYFIVAKLDSSNVPDMVASYVQENLLILFLLAAFVTSVLMIALSQWLLEPIMLLRKNLLSAVKNPQAPEILELKNKDNDEITLTLSLIHI